MTPENWLRSMCVRHGLPPECGKPLVPFVQRAFEAPREQRAKLLKLVEADLALRAGLPTPTPPSEVSSDQDRQVLTAVARVLHGWTPSRPMLDLGDQLGDLPK